MTHISCRLLEYSRPAVRRKDILHLRLVGFGPQPCLGGRLLAGSTSPVAGKGAHSPWSWRASCSSPWLPSRRIMTKISISLLVILVCSFFLLSDIQAAGGDAVRVAQVIDGDSLKVERGGRYFQVRLWGIDAPEWQQAFSAQAKAVCRALAAGKKVSLEEKYSDAYGRTVAVVRVDGTVLNEELVKRGMAWVHIRYCDEEVCSRWRDLEAEARRRHLGLWRDRSPTPPWRWKSQGRGQGRYGN